MPEEITDWHTVHVHHHDPAGIDALLRDGVAPLLDRIAPQVDAAYFTRHWRRGPHVRIEVRCAADAWPGVRAGIGAEMAAYLADHPSGGHPDRDRERVLHTRMAELEDERGPLEPWHQDNSVQDEPHDDRLHVLGTPAAADLLTRFHVATTPLALRLLDHKGAGGQLSVPVLQIMIATAQLGCPPIERGFLSYRSHAEGFFANTADPAAFRARYDEAYTRNRDELAALMREALAACGPDGEPAWPLDMWIPVVAAFRELVAAAVDRDDVVLPAIPDVAAGAPMAAGMTVSPFHQELFGNDAVRAELSSGAWFQRYRVLLNYQYLLFSRVGMIPRERFLMCYLAARTVEEAYGITRPVDLAAVVPQ